MLVCVFFPALSWLSRPGWSHLSAWGCSASQPGKLAAVEDGWVKEQWMNEEIDIGTNRSRRWNVGPCDDDGLQQRQPRKRLLLAESFSSTATQRAVVIRCSLQERLNRLDADRLFSWDKGPSLSSLPDCLSPGQVTMPTSIGQALLFIAALLSTSCTHKRLISRIQIWSLEIPVMLTGIWLEHNHTWLLRHVTCSLKKKQNDVREKYKDYF